MAHEEAAFNSQHSAVSENQHQNLFTTEGTEATERGKTLPLSHGKPGQANADEQERISDPNTRTPGSLGTPEEQATALAVKLAQTYEELTRLLERNPGMKRQITEGTTKEDKVYQKLKQRLKLADMAPRCQWVRQGGTSCGSPQMKQHIYCFAHIQMAEARDLTLRLPPPEDANAIQVGLMRIQKALIEGTISTKTAGLLLYSMQLALTNVGQTTFGQAKDEEMVRETVDEETALSRQQSALSETQTFETQRNGGSGGDREIVTSVHRDIGSSGHQNLPRMDADEGGLKVEIRPVEWKPTPDMYRMDTREGREAYEASLRSSGERRPVQAVSASEESAETYAVLG